MSKKRPCKHHPMPVKGLCLHQNPDPTLSECLDCVTHSLYLCLIENKTAQAMDCLHILVNIHNKVKELLALGEKKLDEKKPKRRFTHREKNLLLAVLAMIMVDFEIEKHTGVSFEEIDIMMQNGEWDSVEEILRRADAAVRREAEAVKK